MIGCSETQLAISGVSDSFGRRFIGALQDQAARSRAKHVSASDLLSVAMSIFENCKYDTPKLSSVYLGNKMKTETKQSPWNTSMTESETRELVRKYLCDGYFHHAHLGEMYIADYDNYIASRPAMFAIVFEYCPGTAFVTLEEFFRDRSCVEACEYGNEKFAQIFAPDGAGGIEHHAVQRWRRKLRPGQSNRIGQQVGSRGGTPGLHHKAAIPLVQQRVMHP